MKKLYFFVCLTFVANSLVSTAGAITFDEVKAYQLAHPEDIGKPVGTVLAASVINVPTGSDIKANGVAFQNALNNAQCGDTIVLEAGATYVNNEATGILSYYPSFVLPGKNCSGNYITIQSSRLSSLPPEGTRVSISDAVNMPKVVTNSSYGAISVAQGASYYKFVGVEFTKINPNVFNEEALVNISYFNDRYNFTTERATSLHHFIFDRVYVHGTEDGTSQHIATSRGGINIDAHNVEVKNSRIAGFRGLDKNGDSVASVAINSSGGLGADDVTITNNYLEGWFVTMFLGGGSGWSSNNAVLVGQTTVNNNIYQSTFSRTPNLAVGDAIAINFGKYHSSYTWPSSPSEYESWKIGKVTAINGNVVSYAPFQGSGPRCAGSDCQFNVLNSVPPNNPANPTEVQWRGYMPRRWKIERNQMVRLSSVVKAVDDAIFARSGNHSLGKGHIEIKGCESCVINGNIFEGSPVSFTLTARNQNGGTPWFTLNNTIFSNNWIKKDTVGHLGGSHVFGMLFDDYYGFTEETKNFQVVNNLIEMSGANWIVYNYGDNLTVSHNTVMNTDKVGTLSVSGASVFGYNKIDGSKFSDNIFYNRKGDGTVCYVPGTDGSYTNCWDKLDNRNVRIRTNTSGDNDSYISSSKAALQTLYPTDYIADSIAEVGFANPGAGDYSLTAQSQFKGRGSDGTDPGVNMSQLLAAVAGAYSAPVPTPVPTPVVTPTPTPTPPSGIVSVLPLALDFSSALTGSGTSAQRVAFFNNGPSAITSITPQVTGDYVITTNYCTFGAVPNSHCDVYVAFRPSVSGRRDGTLSFVYSGSTTPLRVNLTGQGSVTTAPLPTPTPDIIIPAPTPVPTISVIYPTPTPTSIPVPTPTYTPIQPVPTPAPSSVTTFGRTYKTGTLLVDKGTVYFISNGTKIPFTSLTAFLGLGYSLRNVSRADTLGIPQSSGFMLSSPSQEHPWGSWLLNGTTVYYYSSQGMIPIPSWQIFLNNGGESRLIVRMSQADLQVLNQSPAQPIMTLNDSRVLR